MSGYILDLRKAVGKRPLIQCGACVIIRKADKILLQLRKENNKWGLPGGSMEIGERIEDTAVREVNKETGLNILPKNLYLFSVFSGERQHCFYPNGDEVFNVVTAFTTTLYDGQLRADNEEVSSLKFFDFVRLPKELNPPEIEIIEAFFVRLLALHEGNITGFNC